MHPVEVQDALDTFHILVDTREQPTDKARRRYRTFGCPWERKKLDFGDYSAAVILPEGELSLAGQVAVERKMSLDELCQCFTHDRARFEREFERARAVGARIYLLIENASWELAYNGKYRSKMSPASLVGSIMAWQARYDCHVEMCKSETSGRVIHDILYREMKERLAAL